MKSHKILLIIPYFGKWPVWFALFVDSIQRNAGIDFLFVTDCDAEPLIKLKNVKVEHISFEKYIERYKKILGSYIQIPNPYKICDLRPFFGLIHEKDIKGYDFFGWTDVDLVFGDIRSFYTDELLSNYDVFSTHQDRLSGHLALLRNTEYLKNIGFSIYNWKESLQNPNFVGIDEHGITNALTMTFWDKVSEKLKQKWISNLFSFVQKKKSKRFYFKEQYTTPFITVPWLDGSLNSQQPSVWFYENGKVWNERDGERNFLYLHFMNFKSSQWRHDGTKAPWEGKEKIYFVENFRSKVKIDATGFKNVK
jgi:hypothetical protein